jgi:hypothetical protein
MWTEQVVHLQVFVPADCCHLWPSQVGRAQAMMQCGAGARLQDALTAHGMLVEHTGALNSAAGAQQEVKMTGLHGQSITVHQRAIPLPGPQMPTS